MYRLIDDIGKIYRHEPQPPYEQKNTPLSPALCMNLDTIRKNFGESADLAVRDIKLSGINAAVISIDNMIDKQVLAEGVLSPLFSFSFSSEPDTCFNEIKYKAVHTADIMETDSFEKIEAAVMSGFAVILINGCEKGIAVGIQGYASRSVSQPDSDVVQRGSKEGFVEALRVNMTLIRRRLKNPALKFETMTIGETGRTEIALRLMEGEFIDYRRIIPSESSTKIVVNKELFTGSIERASLLAKEGKNNLFKITVRDDLMTITSRSEEGNVREELVIDKTGNDIEIGFNSKYVMDVIKEIDDETVTLHMNTSVTPCVVRPAEGDSYEYLILPVRIPSM